MSDVKCVECGGSIKKLFRSYGFECAECERNYCASEIASMETNAALETQLTALQKENAELRETVELLAERLVNCAALIDGTDTTEKQIIQKFSEACRITARAALEKLKDETC